MLSIDTFNRITKARNAKNADKETIPEDKVVKLVKQYESNGNWHNIVVISDKIKTK